MDNQSSKLFPLSKLAVGASARVHSFSESEIASVLVEMGLVPGAIVAMERIAPLGDPIAVRIAGYTLAIRKKHAANIFLEPL